MTRERIAAGLELLCLQLANGDTTLVPDGWTAHEWMYVKGLATGAIWLTRTRLLPMGQV